MRHAAQINAQDPEKTVQHVIDEVIFSDPTVKTHPGVEKAVERIERLMK